MKTTTTNNNIIPTTMGTSTTATTTTIRASSTYYSSEVEKFNALSDTWWDPKYNPLISMNVIRMKFIKNCVIKYYHKDTTSISSLSSTNNNNNNGTLPLTNIKALDIGCGGGLLSQSLARLGANVYGIDPSESLIEAAKQQAEKQLSNDVNDRLTYIPGVTVEDFYANQLQEDSDDDKFDIVCSLEVIEHVPDPTSLLQTASKLLKPNGLLFVSTINKTAKSYALAIVGAEYVTRKIPMGTHDWNLFKSPNDVEKCLIDSNMESIVINGMIIPPLSVPSILLHNQWNWILDPNDTDVNWIGCYQKKT